MRAGTIVRTLLRPGRRGLVVRLDGRGGPRFVVEGAERDHQTVFDLDAALHLFAAVERGEKTASQVRRWRIPEPFSGPVKARARKLAAADQSHP